jgi:hypothetical protein
MSQVATQAAAAPSYVDCCKDCEVHLIAAERELSAFVKAIDLLFGKVESLRAAEYWLTLADSAEIPMTDRCPNWRGITVQAADRFASTIVQGAGHIRLKEET